MPSEIGRAIICDDDPLARDVVSTVLLESGFAVVAEVSNGAELIQLAELVHPDIVIVDNALVGMSGIESIPPVRAAVPDAVIVMLSAFDAALEEAPLAGADFAVDKMEVGQLGRRITEFLASKAGGEPAALG